MKAVMVSEFRDNISAHVDQVRSGGMVAVVRHNKQVAWLVPATVVAIRHLLARLEKGEQPQTTLDEISNDVKAIRTILEGSDVQPV